MANLTEVKVPDIGDASGVDVIEVLVNVGDEISVDDGLIVLETDKATMEVPSSDAGIVKSVEIKVGDKVSEGDLILKIEAASEDSSESEQEDSSAEASDDSKEEQGTETAESKEQSQEKPKSSGASRTESITIPDIGDSEGVDVIEINQVLLPN